MRPTAATLSPGIGSIPRALAAAILLLTLVPGLPHAAPVSTAPDTPRAATAEYQRAYVAALKAYRGQQPEVFLRAARRALQLRPEHPPAVYLMAAALALESDADGALENLNHLADLGLSFQPQNEPGFAALHKGERFARVVARFAENLQPIGRADIAVETRGLPGDFIPESLAWDAERKRWLLGSIRQRRIVAVAADGAATDLVGSAANGLFSAQGMAIVGDELFVASSALREMQPADPAQIGSTGLFAFALDSGAARGRWLLDSGRVGALGDVLPLPGGLLLTTDSLGGGVYALHRATRRFITLLAPGQLTSPQGMAPLGPQRVAVADYDSGIHVLSLGLPDPSSKPTSAVARSRRKPLADLAPLPSTVPAALYGIDGLYAHDDSLIAIQNGTRPQRILRLQLDAAHAQIVKVEVLAASLPEWDEPTLGVVLDDAFYFVANSHWSKFDEQGKLPPTSELSPPRIMKIAL